VNMIVGPLHWRFSSGHLSRDPFVIPFNLEKLRLRLNFLDLRFFKQLCLWLVFRLVLRARDGRNNESKQCCGSRPTGINGALLLELNCRFALMARLTRL
jgi:hypothetical protein